MDWGFLWGMVELKSSGIWNDKALFYEFLFPCARGHLDLLACSAPWACSAGEGSLSQCWARPPFIVLDTWSRKSMVLNWMELDDDQDSLVIWKMGQFDFSFRVNISPEVLHVKGQGQLRLLVKRAPYSTDRLDPLELAQWPVPPTMYIFLPALCTERGLAQCCPGGAGAIVGGKGQNGFYQRIGHWEESWRRVEILMSKADLEEFSRH